MLGAFANAFRTPDLRRKLLFVLLIVTVFRLGSQVPTPGVNVANVQSCINQVEQGGLYSLINLFSGGALLLAFAGWLAPSLADFYDPGWQTFLETRIPEGTVPLLAVAPLFLLYYRAGP